MAERERTHMLPWYEHAFTHHHYILVEKKLKTFKKILPSAELRSALSLTSSSTFGPGAWPQTLICKGQAAMWQILFIKESVQSV